MKHLQLIKILILQFFFFSGSLLSQTRTQIDSLLNLTDRDWDLNKNIDFYKSVYKDAEKINYEKGKLKSLYTLAGLYMREGQFNKALGYFEKIDTIPITIKENYYYKAKALIDKNFAYSNLGFFEDAQLAINKSLEIANKLEGDDYYLIKGRAYETQAALLIELKKPENSVLKYLKLASANYKQVEKKDARNYNLQGVYCNINTSYTELGKKDSATVYIRKILKMNPIYDEFATHTYFRMANYHKDKKNWDSAIIYCKKSLIIAQKVRDPIILKEIYFNLSELYEKINDKDSSLFYSKKYAQLTDSLNDVNKKGALVASQNIKKEAKEESKKQQQQLYWIIGSILILFCLALLYSWKLFKNYRKEKKERLLKKEIIQKKNIELEEMKSKVNDSFDEVIQLAKANNPSFLSRFREVYPDFSGRIIDLCPDIHNSELIFCAYIKLNFSTKEISNYTFTSIKTVQNRKTRLRKRLNIPSEDDLYIWINNI